MSPPLTASSFYVIVPSNTNVDGNMSNSFRVRLPRKLEFNSDWMVGLAVLVYPHSWPSLGTSSQQYIKLYWNAGINTVINVPSSNFHSPNPLLGMLNDLLFSHHSEFTERLNKFKEICKKVKNELVERTKQEAIDILTQELRKNNDEKITTHDKVSRVVKIHEALIEKYYRAELLSVLTNVDDRELFSKISLNYNEIEEWINAFKQIDSCLKFEYNENRQRFSATSNSLYISKIELSEQLAYIMGYQTVDFSPGLEFGKFMPDMNGGISSFNVYSPGLIEPVIVGDVSAPLLRMVNIRGMNGEIIEENYFAIQYHRLLVREVSEIVIECKALDGSLIPFQYGSVILTLHFKKTPYF
jgi:hypothetical protein